MMTDPYVRNVRAVSEHGTTESLVWDLTQKTHQITDLLCTRCVQSLFEEEITKLFAKTSCFSGLLDKDCCSFMLNDICLVL